MAPLPLSATETTQVSVRQTTQEEDVEESSIVMVSIGGTLRQAVKIFCHRIDTLAVVVGIPTFVPSAQFSDVLATEIACRLDPQEQEKAAAATDEVTRGGAVGTTAEWQSDTRPGVRGRSTVTARTETASGSDCLCDAPAASDCCFHHHQSPGDRRVGIHVAQKA